MKRLYTLMLAICTLASFTPQHLFAADFFESTKPVEEESGGGGGGATGGRKPTPPKEIPTGAKATATKTTQSYFQRFKSLFQPAAKPQYSYYKEPAGVTLKISNPAVGKKVTTQKPLASQPALRSESSDSTFSMKNPAFNHPTRSEIRPTLDSSSSIESGFETTNPLSSRTGSSESFASDASATSESASKKYTPGVKITDAYKKYLARNGALPEQSAFSSPQPNFSEEKPAAQKSITKPKSSAQKLAEAQRNQQQRFAETDQMVADFKASQTGFEVIS